MYSSTPWIESDAVLELHNRNDALFLSAFHLFHFVDQVNSKYVVCVSILGALISMYVYLYTATMGIIKKHAHRRLALALDFLKQLVSD